MRGYVGLCGIVTGYTLVVIAFTVSSVIKIDLIADSIMPITSMPKMVERAYLIYYILPDYLLPTMAADSLMPSTV
jgi:hypothetical protein